MPLHYRLVLRLCLTLLQTGSTGTASTTGDRKVSSLSVTFTSRTTHGRTGRQGELARPIRESSGMSQSTCISIRSMDILFIAG